MSSIIDQIADNGNKDVQFMVNVTLIQYLYMTGVCIASLVVLAKFYWISRKGRSKLSFQLRIHLYAWNIFIIITLLHVGSFVMIFRGIGAEYNTIFVLIKSSASFSALVTEPISGFFIILDRIHAMSFAGMQNSLRRRFYIQNFSIFVLCTSFFSIFFVILARGYMTLNSMTTTCLTLTCVIKNNLRDFVWIKLCLGIANLVFGTIFVWLYYRYGRKLAVRREKRKNFLSLLLLFNEILFNLIPTGIYLLFYIRTTTVYVSGSLGSIMTTAYCTDAIFTALFYYSTWRDRMSNPNSIRIIRLNKNGSKWTSNSTTAFKQN